MRFARTAALVGVALLWWAFGPMVLLLAAGSLYFRRVRGWLRPTRRVLLGWAVGVAVVAGLAYVVPDGWLRIAPGAGVLVTPSYVGRPAIVAADEVTAPLGESPRVTTKSYGTTDCHEVGFDSHGRLVTTCEGTLRLIDPDSLRQLATKELPANCPLVFSVVRDRALVAVDDQVVAVATADAEDEPDLTTAATVDLPGDLGCLTGLEADGHGRTWFSTADGVVGLVDGTRVRTLDLDDTVDRPLAVADDAVYVPGSGALHKVIAAKGRPVLAWSSAYDGGERGSAPVVLPSGLVAVADDRDPRLQVVLHRGDTGDVACRVELFDDDESATDGGMVAAGDGVLVLNQHGYGGTLSTALGRTTTGGIARVDQRCDVSWESDLDAPSGAPAVSTEAGLAYVYTKRHSWLGANAWYLTAVDLDTGRAVWARRTGLGVLRDNHGGIVTLGPDGSVYVPVLGGFVRVRDRS
ncbi:MAG TPA: hypothetical protein VFT70_18715 [Nocardioides sp.]|nr:hypothetical protein [Nocardioides sp.]